MQRQNLCMFGFLVNITLAMINEGKFLEMHQISLSKEDMANMENEMSMLLISRRFNSATMPVMIIFIYTDVHTHNNYIGWNWITSIDQMILWPLGLVNTIITNYFWVGIQEAGFYNWYSLIKQSIVLYVTAELENIINVAPKKVIDLIITRINM